MRKYLPQIKLSELTQFLLIVILGFLYVGYKLQKTKEELEIPAKQLARSIVVSLPFDSLLQLNALPSDTSLYLYKSLKEKLFKVVETNPHTLSAYLYLLRDSNLFFMIDSTPEDNPDMSLPGDGYFEADQVYFQPFQDGKERITEPTTDRWGTWVSTIVPVKDKQTGKVFAVLGIDYEASEWHSKLLFEILESGLLVLIALFLFLAILISRSKNAILRDALLKSEIAEKKLNKSEVQLSNLLSNLPGFVYRCALDENYTMEFISEGCLEITGYSSTDFIGNKNISFDQIILQEYLQPIADKWDRVIKQKTYFREEYRIETASGEIKWIWERGKGVYDKEDNLIYLEGYIEEITSRKLAVDQLQQSEENLTRTIKNSPFGIRIVSPYGKTLYSNPTLQGIFGAGETENTDRFSANDSYTPKSYAEHMVREEKRIKGLPVESEYEVSILRPDKEIRNLQVFRSKIIWNGTLNNQIIYLDITDRKNAESELRKLSKAIEQNPVSVFITDKNGIIEYVNKKFIETSGYEYWEVIGENPRILKSGMMDKQIYTDLWNTIISGKKWHGELINRKKSGELFWLHKSISSITDSEGLITHFVSIAEDITDKKKAEAELIAAKEKAVESDRLKSLFLANISHEIRTPMNGILGFAELLKEPDLSAENQLEFVNVIESSGQRMLNIINDLIDISKIEAGEMTIRIRPADINELLREIHLFFLPEAKKKDLRINYHCTNPGEEFTIETDGMKLNQILTNLIKNAIKFTKEGSIDFGYQLLGQTLEFYVADTGPGIPEEHREQIFERFRQSSLNLTRNYEGAGLGLAISKAYVEMLGGTIRVESDLGKGSRFIFDIPVKSA